MKTKTAEMKFGLSTLSLSLSLLEKELDHNSAFACEAKKGRSTFSLHANHQAPTTRMEGRSRRERAPKRGAAALAALTRLRGGGATTTELMPTSTPLPMLLPALPTLPLLRPGAAASSTTSR